MIDNSNRKKRGSIDPLTGKVLLYTRKDGSNYFVTKEAFESYRAKGRAWTAANKGRKHDQYEAKVAGTSIEQRRRAPGGINRRLKDPAFKLYMRVAVNVNRSLRQLLSGKQKSLEPIRYLGCNAYQLKSHLENAFKDGMHWGNRGACMRTEKRWQMDHIIPMKQFDLSDPNQQLLFFNYTNLQPLWWWENRAKSDKVI